MLNELGIASKKLVSHYIIFIYLFLFEIITVSIGRLPLDQQIRSFIIYLSIGDSGFTLFLIIVRVLIYSILYIMVYAGVFHLSKIAILGEKLTFEKFLKGIKQNWLKVLILTLIIGLISYIVTAISNMFFYSLGIFVGMFMSSLIFIIRTLLFTYLGFRLIEERTAVKDTLRELKDFVLSRNFAKTMVLLSIFNGIIVLINYRISLYIMELNFKYSNDIGLLSFFNLLTEFYIPKWVHWLESISSTLFIAFVFIFNSYLLYKPADGESVES